MLTIGALLLAWLLTPQTSPGSRESALAVAQAMTARHLDAFAAADPADAHRFVAVRFYPGQLLLITGRYPVPSNLTSDMAQRHYGNIYAALYAAAEREGRLFVHDMGADGLAASQRDAPDVVYEQVETRRIVDRAPSGKTGDPYDVMYSEVERRYAAALQLLMSQLAAPVGSGGW